MTSAPPSARFSLTYEIPDQFGGLTQAMLRRTVEMTRRRREPCRVLTVGPQPNLSRVRTDLHDRGLLADPSHLRNLWEDLAEDSWLDGLDPDPLQPEPTLRDGTDVVIERPDGSRLAVQRWVRLGVRSPVAPTGDAVTDTWLWSADGTYLGHLPGTWSIWRRWLERVIAESAADRVDVLIDSATVADAVAGLDAPRARLSVVIHNNHLRLGAVPPVAPLNRWRSHLLERANLFDAVIFLTDQQRHDARLLLDGLDRAVTVPNIGPDPDRRPMRRSSHRGLMLAALTPRKRVDHAIRAAAKVPQVSITVHGEGDRRNDLQRLIDELQAPVDLAGYTTDPRAALRAASFLVLTSSGEGLPMVLLEAISAGCLPVAYDIAYGPRDVITPGVDGILVSPTDPTTLADELGRLVVRNRWRLGRMRRAALRRALDFTADAVTQRWDEVLAATAGRTVSEPSIEDESQAAITRFLSPELAVRICDAIHLDDGDVELHLQIDVLVNGRPDALDTPVESLCISLVDRTDGSRRALDHRVDGDRYVLKVDVEHLDGRSLLVAGTVWQVPATGLVTGTVGPQPWQSFPPERRLPTVLTIEPALGLSVTRASPRATATVTSARGGALQIDAAGDEVDWDVIELTAGSRTRTVEPLAPGRFLVSSDLPHGRWKVRARQSGQWREVALVGQVEASPVDVRSPLYLDLTPKGYLRLVSQLGAVVVHDLLVVDDSLRLSGVSDCATTLKIGSLEHVVGAGPWSVTIDPGTTVGAIRAKDASVLASPSLEARWPVVAATTRHQLVLHRQGRRADPALTPTTAME